MKRQMIVIGVTVGLMLGVAAQADIYRWRGSDGVIHFSNDPPPPGAAAIERTEEAPYDAEADRQRAEEERQLRQERQRLELEERKAELAAREREARARMDEADRRMNEAREVQQRPPEPERSDDCDDDYYLRFGTCGSFPVYGGGFFHGRPVNPNLYRGYYRDNNNLYYKDPPRPGHPPGHRPPHRPGVKPAPGTDSARSAPRVSKPPAAGEEPVVNRPVNRPAPAASK